MYFFMKFVFSMRKRTFILKFTFSKEFPISTHLCLVFYLVLSNEVFSLFFRVKMLLWFFYCGLFEIFVRWQLFFNNSIFWHGISLVLLIISYLSWGIWTIIKGILMRRFSISTFRNRKQVIILLLCSLNIIRGKAFLDFSLIILWWNGLLILLMKTLLFIWLLHICIH